MLPVYLQMELGLLKFQRNITNIYAKCHNNLSVFYMWKMIWYRSLQLWPRYIRQKDNDRWKKPRVSLIMVLQVIQRCQFCAATWFESSGKLLLYVDIRNSIKALHGLEKVLSSVISRRRCRSSKQGLWNVPKLRPYCRLCFAVIASQTLLYTLKFNI